MESNTTLGCGAGGKKDVHDFLVTSPCYPSRRYPPWFVNSGPFYSNPKFTDERFRIRSSSGTARLQAMALPTIRMTSIIQLGLLHTVLLSQAPTVRQEQNSTVIGQLRGEMGRYRRCGTTSLTLNILFSTPAFHGR
jgi:hypothetical protein